MFRSSKRLSSRAFIALTLSGATLSAAGAATFHRFAVGQTTGSSGSTTFLQSGTGSALQGEVAPSANTGITTKFGVLGEFNPSGSTFGVGTIGISTTGYAVAGESLSDTQPSLLAYPGGNGIGLEATTQSTSSSPAILAVSKGTGDGIDGTISNVGQSSFALGYGGAGVFGQDLAKSSSTSGAEDNSGVTGQTNYGYAGVLGYASGGNEFSGTPVANIGVDGYSDAGVGVSGQSAGSHAAITADAEGSGDGIDITSVSGEVFSGSTGDDIGALIENKSNTYATLEATQLGQGNIISASSQSGYLFLENNGNLEISGSLSDSSASQQRTENPNSDVMSYGDEVTQPTIEDVGSAHLVNGSAMVSLASDYRQTIDGSGYMVFLTPNGQSHGLYIASKSPTGFVVRENDGGRSTLAFDYRIVAQQYGEHEGRLPHFATIHPELTKQRLAAIRSDSLKRYNASREKLAAQTKRDLLMRPAFQHHSIPRPLPANPLGVSFTKR